MAIEGPIRELPLSDLLQLLFLSRKTGSLVVSDETQGHNVLLELDRGALTGATGSSPETRLGHLLVGSGRATDGQIQRALGSQRLFPGRRLGEVLVEIGALHPAEVQRHLRFQVEEAVFDLMRWKQGQIRFEEGPTRDSGLIEVRLPTDLVLMDTVRRLDEWAEVTSAAPDADPLPRLAAPNSGIRPALTLQPLEWEVLGKVDGDQTLRRIARSLGRGELEVARAIYSLASAGLVEVSNRIAVAQPGGSDLFEVEARACEADLQAGRIRDAERRAHALLAARPAAAGVHVLQGRIHIARLEWDAAIRTFDRAIEMDPLLPIAYYHLARAAIRSGDLHRAGEALETYRRLSDPSLARRQAAERMAGGLEQILDVLDAEAG